MPSLRLVSAIADLPWSLNRVSDLWFIPLFAVVALGVAWLVNGLVALLSGEHPRDTRSVWLDIVLGDFRGFSSVLSLLRTRLKASVRDFSMNRFAYSLDVISLLLLAVHPLADTHFGKKRIMGVAFVLAIMVLLMCLLTPSTVRNRWLPFLIAFILLLIHGLFIPHL